MEDLLKKIQDMSLTKTDESIADYFVENFDTIGLQTSTTLAQNIGVSDTSLIRFIRKLGFRGYAEFRREMSERIAQRYIKGSQDLSPSEKYVRTKAFLNQNSLVQEVTKYTLENLQKSMERLDNETLNRVVDIILSSDRKYVVGFRGTASCAQYMASKLVLLLPHTRSITHADATAIESIIDITKEDCLILYSFPRYTEMNQTLLDIARSRGAKIILITDRLTSPLAAKADVVLIAHVGGLGFTNSYAVPMSVSEVILLAISTRNDAAQQQRIQDLDRAINEGKLY